MTDTTDTTPRTRRGTHTTSGSDLFAGLSNPNPTLTPARRDRSSLTSTSDTGGFVATIDLMAAANARLPEFNTFKKRPVWGDSSKFLSHIGHWLTYLAAWIVCAVFYVPMLAGWSVGHGWLWFHGMLERFAILLLVAAAGVGVAFYLNR